MVAHLAWRLIRDRPGDLIDERRKARVLVVLLLGGQFLADLIIDVVMGFDWQPRAFSIVQNAALLAFTGWLLHLQFRPSARPLPDAVRSGAKAHPSRLRRHRRRPGWESGCGCWSRSIGSISTPT